MELLIAITIVIITEDRRLIRVLERELGRLFLHVFAEALGSSSGKGAEVPSF